MSLLDTWIVKVCPLQITDSGSQKSRVYIPRQLGVIPTSPSPSLWHNGTGPEPLLCRERVCEPFVADGFMQQLEYSGPY